MIANMDEFNIWEISGKQEASEMIAKRIESMHSMFQECVMIAKEFDIRLSINVPLPENAYGGHNTCGLSAMWNPSGQYC